MWIRNCLGVFVVVFLVVSFSFFVSGVEDDLVRVLNEDDFVEGEIIVKFKEGVSNKIEKEIDKAKPLLYNLTLTL